MCIYLFILIVVKSDEVAVRTWTNNNQDDDMIDGDNSVINFTFTLKNQPRKYEIRDRPCFRSVRSGEVSRLH